MLIPAFQLFLQDGIVRGQAAIGRYDGKHPSLTCATSGGKVFIHSPHNQEIDMQTVSYLNINRAITSILAGRLDTEVERDILLIGSPTSLQSYDVQENRDLFFCEIPDGVNTAVLGNMGTLEGPLVIVGGNCSIQGFDAQGTELYWTVTGDNVSCLSLVDTNEDGQLELLVGSEDFDIRIFHNEDVISEISEADVVVGLTPIQGQKYGYALANGTIGMYNGTSRVWRVKSKHSLCAISGFDLDGDGVPELLSGWSNGRVEVRKDETGEVLFRDTFNAPISAILEGDYKGHGSNQVIVCSEDGEVRGYMPLTAQQEEDGVDLSAKKDALEKFNQKKQELLYELSSLSMKATGTAQSKQCTSVVPQGTEISCSVCVDREAGEAYLLLQTNNETLIKGAIIFGENLFAGESHLTYLDEPQKSVQIPLKPAKDIPSDTLVKVLVSSGSGHIYSVLEHEPRIPKFLMYATVEEDIIKPQSHVAFVVQERIPRLCLWLSSRFCITPLDQQYNNNLEQNFISLRNGKPLVIDFARNDMSCTVTIRTDSMEVAGDIVQDMAGYLGIGELQSSAMFPVELEAFQDVLSKVDEHNNIRMRLAADVADCSNTVKMLVVKAEDTRIMGNMKAMKKAYRKLYELNQELLGEHLKRATNHSLLLEGLKDVNQMIQKAARLRVGQAKSRVISSCRAAIKQNNVALLFKILKDGDSSG